MDWKIIAIIVLVLLIYYKPNEAHNYLDDGVDKVKDTIGNYNQECPDTISKVCGANNVTYDNSCLADKAGQTHTSGAC